MAANPPDFALLYARLGLPPDCTLEQFKHACRQRIAELHPDRDRAPPGAAAPDLAISELLSLYAGAVRFHRRHGRLPGAQPAFTRGATALQPQVPAHVPETASDADDVAPPSWRGWLLAAVAAALLLALLASLDHGPPGGDALPATPVDPAEAMDDRVAVAAAQLQLELGMDQATVLAIQGEPMQYDDRDWIYGPSWIRFEKGRVVDWYSSPLHRLRTAMPAPPRDAVEATEPP